MKSFHALMILLLNTFLFGMLRRMGVPDFYLKFNTEWSILLLCLAVLVEKPTEFAPGLGFVVVYMCCVALATALSTDSAYTAYRYGRFFVHAYIVTTCVWNAQFTAKQVKTIIFSIFALLAVQIVGSLHEIFVLHGRWEHIVGTVGYGGGGIATSLPLFGMAYFTALYLYCGHKPWMLVVALSFPVVGFASHKRAIYFVLPWLVGAEFLWYMLREKRLGIALEWVRVGVALVAVAGMILFGIRNTTRIAMRDAVGVGEELQGAAEYAQEYTFAKRRDATTGRMSTSARVLQAAKEKDVVRVLFGWGPGALMGTGGKFEKLGIIYGVTGWAFDAICVGWVAMASVLLFYLLYWRRLALSAGGDGSPLWKALCLGSHAAFLVFVFTHLFYDTAFSMSGTLSFPMYTLLSLLLSPRHRWLQHADLSTIPIFGQRVVRRRPAMY